MAEIVFNPALLDIQTQDLDWINGNIRCLLLTGSGSPAKGNATVAVALGEANVAEADATGYTRVSAGVRTIVGVGDTVEFRVAATVFESVGNGTNNDITGALFYVGTLDSGDDSTNKPIAFTKRSGGGAVTTNGADVTVQMPGDYLFRVGNPLPT
jgi:hypothetical protein